jgi:hypothetical protein
VFYLEGLKTTNQEGDMISEPVYYREGMWGVETPQGMKIFSDQETAYDFYLLNKHREEQKSDGNSPDPR